MATKPMVAGDSATAEQDVETTLLDVQTAAVKRLIAKGKERGYITFDELNAILPSDQNSKRDKMIRGGSWNYGQYYLQGDLRSSQPEDQFNLPKQGFRCARSRFARAPASARS